MLLDKKYTSSEARTILELLHDFRDEDLAKADTFVYLAGCLANKRVAIAELGFYHLIRLARGQLPKEILNFNAADALEPRKAIAAKVSKLVEDGKLPPPPPREAERQPGAAPKPKGP